MNSKTIAYGILRALGILLGVVFLFWFLYKIQSVLVYLGIAAVVSLLGRPIVYFLRTRLKMGDSFAAIIAIVVIFTAIAGVLSLFIPIIVDQSENVSEIDFEKVKVNFNRLYGQIADYFGVSKSKVLEAIKQTDFVKEFDYGIIPRFLNGIIGNLGAAVIGIFSVMFISFFFLKDSTLLLNSILVFANYGDESRFRTVFEKIKHLLSRYFLGLVIQVLLMFIMYTILLSIFGVQNALPIALFCATLNLVPYLGPLVGGMFMLLLATSGYLDSDFQSAVIFPKLIYIFIGYVIAQLIDNFLIQPFIFGNSVKSHPLEIFLAIIIAGLLFGVVGMVFAIPTYTAIKVISNEFLSEYKIVQKLTKDL